MQGPYHSSQSSSRQIPTDVSFLVSYEPLKPNYQKQAIRKGRGDSGFWAPPNRKIAYHRDTARAKLFRWRGGRVTELAHDPSSRYSFTRHSVATVFTQYPDTDHLLAVDFDAEEKNVVEDPGGWKVLGFRHQPQPGTEKIYSYVDVWGTEQQMAAPGSPHWVPQLLPSIYDYDPSQPAAATTWRPSTAGLIGHLPILFALPAFSAPPERLAQVLTGHLQPNRWVPHQFCHGRIAERGMVVTVYLDPANLKLSSKVILDQLQDGYWGAFYGA
ncbi:MAG: hypothetical protein Q9216_006824 [Gyalolechia sp. 2 TL-2023]